MKKMRIFIREYIANVFSSFKIILEGKLFLGRETSNLMIALKKKNVILNVKKI